MYTYTPTSRADRTALSQGARGADLSREAHHAAFLKGHLLARRAAHQLLLPVQLEGRLGVAALVLHPPRPAVNLKLFGTIPHQLAGKVRSVYVQLLKAHPLSTKVGTYGISDTGLSNVGRRDAHGS